MQGKRRKFSSTVKPILFSVGAILLMSTTNVSAQPPTKPTVSVLPLKSAETASPFDVLCATVTNNIALTLRLMDRYRVVAPRNAVAQDDMRGIREYAESEGIDNVIYGQAEQAEDGKIMIQISVYDRFEDRVTLKRSATAVTIFDVFDAADSLVIAIIEGFSGIHVGYGTLEIVNRGAEGSFTVYIDDESFGERTIIDRIFIGERRIRLVQKRPAGEYELLSTWAIIRENVVTSIDVALPYLVPEEALRFSAIDRAILREILYREDKPKAGALLSKGLELASGLPPGAAREELTEKYQRWRDPIRDAFDRRGPDERGRKDRRKRTSTGLSMPVGAIPSQPAHGDHTTIGSLRFFTRDDGNLDRSITRLLVDMVYVEAGTFQMGSTDGGDNEKPAHSVTISKSFYLSKYEVTQKQWRDVMGNNPSSSRGDNLPVENVSWYKAVEYCNKLSREEGLSPCYSGTGYSIRCDFTANGYRLPTEAEWEYAARGGNKSRDYTYSGSNSVGDVG